MAFIILSGFVSAAYLLLAAHIRSEGFGDVHAAVGIEVILKERYEHSRRGDDGVVERVGEVLAVLAVDADFKPARLRVTEVRTGADLEVFLLSGRPRLDVYGLHLEIRKVVMPISWDASLAGSVTDVVDRAALRAA